MVIRWSRHVVHRLQRLLPTSRGGVVFFAYHLIGGGTSLAVDVPLSTFCRQIEELRRSARICSLKEAIPALEGDEPCEQPVVVLTFDDAYENFYQNVWPVLREHQIPTTLYVPADFIEGTGSPPLRGTVGMNPCTWDQLREMAESGLVSVGSHTCSHVNLRTVGLPRARGEIVESKARLEDRLGQPVESFAYPQGSWSRALEEIVAQHYRTAVLGGGRKMKAGRCSLHRLGRVPVRKDMPASLASMLSSPVWLEEWIASRVRPWRRSIQSIWQSCGQS